jgi:hypothetical protein
MTVSVTRSCGIYGWHDTDTYNTGMHFIRFTFKYYSTIFRKILAILFTSI